MANGLSLAMGRTDERKTQKLMSDLEQGKIPEKKVLEQTSNSLQETQKSLDSGEQIKEPKELSNGDLFARILIGLAPQLLGAVAGKSMGISAAEGGLAGAQAGLTGLKTIDTLEKEQRDLEKEKAKEARELAKERTEAKRLGIQESKETRQTLAELEKLGISRQELALKQKELGLKEETKGKAPSAEQTKLLAGFSTSEKQLADISSEIEKNADKMGPIAGRIRGLSPYQTETKAFDARMKLAAQKIGVALEGGKLTDEDISRYRQMLPNLTDTPEVAREKVKIVQGLLTQERQAQLESMGAGGYNVRGYAKAEEPKPSSIAPKKEGSVFGGMSQAVAAEPARKVIQNGIEYIYNPQTGKYE